jgi:predicted phage terminase large subunit-like protein
LKTGKANARSVIITAADTAEGIYLLDVWADRVDFPGLKAAARATAARWRPNEFLIEDKASGTSLIQELRKEADFGTPVTAIEPQGDKFTRLMAVTPLIASGRVFIPTLAAWRADFLAEVTTFPNHPLKDLVDALSQLLKHLYDTGRTFEQIAAGTLSGAPRETDVTGVFAGGDSDDVAPGVW